MSNFASFVKELAYSGLEFFGKYYSVYRAFVHSNADPENCSRLKVIIPQISGIAVYERWVHSRNVFSGKDYGYQILPQKGDLVWVEFEMGNPEVPIWSHGHFGRGEKPTEDDYKDPDSYWFKSPKGHSVIINDTKEYIYAELKGGKKYLKIAKDKVTLKYQDTEINLDDLINMKTQNESMYKILDDLFTIMETQTYTNSGGETGPSLKLPDIKLLHQRLPKLFK